MISYRGLSKNKLIKKININGTEHELDFYWGNIILSVLGDFDTASSYCYYHGYMGGEDIFKYNGHDSDTATSKY